MTNFFAGTLKYKTGDCTTPFEAGYRIIIHIVNDIGQMGAGVALAISKKWPKVKDEYKQWYRSQNKFVLGEIQEIVVQSDTTVINMIAQHDIKPDKDGNLPIRYEALAKCLEKVAKIAKEEKCTIICPKIGSGLAGGDWLTIENLIKKHLVEKGTNVVIYSLPEAKQ